MRNKTLNILVTIYSAFSLLFAGNSAFSWLCISVGSILFVVAGLKYVSMYRFRVGRDNLLLLPAIFLTYALVSALSATNSSIATVAMLALSSSIVSAFAVWMALQTGVSWYAIAIGFMIGGIGIMINDIPFIMAHGTSIRLDASTGNANREALFLAVASMEILFLRFWKPKAQVLLLFLSLGLIVFAFIFSGSLKSYIYCGFILLYILSQFMRGLKTANPAKLFLGVLIVIALIVGFSERFSNVIDYMSSTTTIRRTLLAMTGDNESTKLRISAVNEAAQVWIENPVFGVGIGQFADYSSEGMGYVHNNYMELLACMGVVGFLLYYGWCYKILSKVLKSRLLSKEFKILIFLVFITLLLTDFGAVTYHLKCVWVMLAQLSYLACTRNTQVRSIGPHIYNRKSLH